MKTKKAQTPNLKDINKSKIVNHRYVTPKKFSKNVAVSRKRRHRIWIIQIEQRQDRRRKSERINICNLKAIRYNQWSQDIIKISDNSAILLYSILKSLSIPTAWEINIMHFPQLFVFYSWVKHWFASRATTKLSAFFENIVHSSTGQSAVRHLLSS